jgi:TRAP-type uncharacterized transport system substrate-binding protein
MCEVTMTRYSTAMVVAISGLFVTTPVWADPLDDPQADSGYQAAQPKPKVHRSKPAEQLRHQMRDQANKGLVGIISEGTDDTVDMAIVLAAEHEGVRLLPIAGAGAAQNAKDLLFLRGIDFGIVQADVLSEIKRKPPFPGVEKYMEYVTQLYDQQLHVLAGPDVKSIDDLNGRNVNFGRRDSGTFTTATVVFNSLGVQPEVTTLPQPLALDRLRRGEISALVYVATKPSRMFMDIRPDDHLHFVPVTSFWWRSGNLGEGYSPAQITSEDYPQIVTADAPVDTLEVGTVLVAYNWPEKSGRYAPVNHFVQAFFTHLKEIKATHPRWQAFDITSTVSGWTRFPGAEQWVKKAERDKLFQQFAEYYKQRTMLALRSPAVSTITYR